MTVHLVYGQYEQIIICTVDEPEKLLEEMKELKCYRVIGNPTGIETGQKAVKIKYSNDEHKLIGFYGQSRCAKERQYQKYRGYHYFDEEEFEAFLQKYIDDETQSTD